MEIAMSLLVMLGGVAAFLYGMKLMSAGIEQSAGKGIKNLFKKMSKRRITDYAVGIAATAIVQSSSATSIMTIGLANANIVTQKQGSGLILGAKVGTTLTAFIFAASGLSKGDFSVGALFSAIAFIGVMISLTTKRESLKKLSLFLTGFGLLFLGLEVMETSIGGADSMLSQQVQKLFAIEAMKSPILLLILGIVFTFVIQSSTAATGIFIVFLTSGMLTLDQACFLVMGANIGTCSDGLMASIGSNVHGKRIALFHVLSSTIGALVFTLVLVLVRTPLMNLFAKYIAGEGLSLAIYNLAYNIIYTLIMLAALDPLVYLVGKMLKEKPDPAVRQLKYIDERLLSTPSIAAEHTFKEVHATGLLAQENLDRAFSGLINEDTSNSKKIAEDENTIDHITRELAGYIIKVSGSNISLSQERQMGGLHHVISDIERIGDHAVNFAKETNFMKQQDLHFAEETKAELNSIYGLITSLYGLCLETFRTRTISHFNEVSSLHREVKEAINNARDNHTERLNNGEYSVELSKSLYAVLLSLRRVSDHLVNVAFSIRSNTGSKTEAYKTIKVNRSNKI